MVTIRSGTELQTPRLSAPGQPAKRQTPVLFASQATDEWIKTITQPRVRFGAGNDDEKRREAYKRFATRLSQGIDMIERTLKVMKLGSKDEQIKIISDMIWERQFKPMVMNHPEETKAKVVQWRETLLREGEPGVLRDSALMLLNAFEKNINNPEKIKKTIFLTTLVMMNGGMDKAKDILKLVSSKEFQDHNVTKQGQLVLETMGPVFVKALQTVNSVPDLFPDHIQESIKPLYEDITPIPFEQIKNIIETEMEQKHGEKIPLEKLYAWINPEPLKAASIAQVHEALMPNGKRVAVKVVKPGVKDHIDENLDMIEPLAKLAQELDPRFNADKFLDEFRSLIKKECDMLQEAQQLEKVAGIFKEVKNLRVPEVYWDRTSTSVLTMEFMEGQGLHKHVGNKKVAKDYLNLLLDMVFLHRACQADPHFGNVPYNADKDVFNFLDAGMVYYTTEKEIISFAKMLTALPIKRADILAEALLTNDENAGKEKEIAEFTEVVKGMLEGDVEFKSRDVLKLVKNIEKEARTRNLKVNFVNPLLWKTLFTAVGVAKTLDPEANVMKDVGFAIFTILFKHDRNFLWRVGLSSFNGWASSWVKKGKDGAKSKVGAWVESSTQKAKNWVSGWFKKKKE